MNIPSYFFLKYSIKMKITRQLTIADRSGFFFSDMTKYE